METRPILLAFNRGLVSKHALARVDLKRMALSAEEQTNWMPKVLGAMSLRNGTRLIYRAEDDGAGDDKKAVFIPFVFSVEDTALLEVTDSVMRVSIDDALIERPIVTTTITNPYFTTDLTGWTDDDEVGATSSSAPGQMRLVGTGSSAAIRDQEVTITAGNADKEHALNISVQGSPVELSVGTTLGGTDYVSRLSLARGSHSIAVTPTVGSMFIRFAGRNEAASIVTGCYIPPDGFMAVPCVWSESDLSNLRYDQSGDVIFVADGAHRPKRIERRATRSWSIVEYTPESGPFRLQNTSDIRLTPGALSGDTTLTASRAFFRSGHVDALFRLGSAGQRVSSSLNAEDTYTDPIRVTGVTTGRAFSITRTGTWVGTLTLQKSLVEPGDWVDVTTYTTNETTSYTDGLDNQEVYYRVGFKLGAYTSGTVVAELSYARGSIEGVCIVDSVTSATVANVRVLKPFGGVASTVNWWEGAWSDLRGWPSATVLHDGRLWWAGNDRIAGSVSDSFDNFDDATEGDSGPIVRSIGAGPVDTINWLVSVASLLVGGQAREFVAKASSLEEPLTPTAFALKTTGTLGSAPMRAVQLDASAVYVHRNQKRLYELSLEGTTYSYVSNDLTAIVPDVGGTGFVRLAVQRTPDTRVHCVRADGKVAILIFDRTEKVSCWVIYETDGAVEDVAILPDADGDDRVYYFVRREGVGGAELRTLERWAVDSEALGAAVTILTDSTEEFTVASSATVAIPARFAGKTIAVWGNSKDLGTYPDVGATVTLPEAVTQYSVGLVYTARFKSAPFSEASEIALNQKQQLHHVGLVLSDTHARGIQFGQDFDHLDGLPMIEEGELVDPDKIWETYKQDSIGLNGSWTNDTRLCLEAASPRPATVLAAIASVTGHAK